MKITRYLKISNREDGWWTQYLKSQFSSEISDFTVGLLGSTDRRFSFLCMWYCSQFWEG